MDENDQSERLEAIRSIKEDVEDELLERPGVVGVDIGYKEVGGHRTDELAIRLLVEEKRDVPPEQRMPQEIEGIRTDVIQRGRIVSGQDTTRHDPLVGGISIGTCGGAPGVGTLGMLVRDRNTNQTMALSNWHVLVGGTTGAFDVTQPGPGDGGRCPGDIIGQVRQSAINEYVDCAVASVNPAARNFSCRIQHMFHNGPAGTQINNRVLKWGRTTGRTYGDVDTLDAAINVNIAGVIRTFKQQIGIWRAPGVNDVFFYYGDSGSVVVGWPNYRNEIVGLLFALSTGNPFFPDGAYAWANPIFAVLDALNVDMCRPPKGKETKDKEKDKEKDKREKEKDKERIKETMKEKESDFLTFEGEFHQMLDAESQLFLEAESTGSAAASQAQAAGPLEERLARLEATVGELRHFIGHADRPNVGESAIQSEIDYTSEQTDSNTQASDDDQDAESSHEG